MTYDSLFNIDEDGYVSKLEKHQLLHPLVKEVYQQDAGSPGDFNGRKKLRALKILTYVWHMADIKSPANVRGLAKDDAHKLAIKLSKLEEDFKPEPNVQWLIDEYEDTSGGVYAKALKNMLFNLSTVSSAIDLIDIELKKTMEELKKVRNVTDEPVIVSLDKALGLITKATAIASDLPSLRKSVTEAYKLVMEEEEEAVARGGDNVKSSQDPTKFIKKLNERRNIT